MSLEALELEECEALELEALLEAYGVGVVRRRRRAWWWPSRGHRQRVPASWEVRELLAVHGGDPLAVVGRERFAYFGLGIYVDRVEQSKAMSRAKHPRRRKRTPAPAIVASAHQPIVEASTGAVLRWRVFDVDAEGGLHLVDEWEPLRREYYPCR